MKKKHKYKSIPKVRFECDLNHSPWWNTFINEKWIASFMDLNFAVDYVYSICEKGTFGEQLDPGKKY